MADDGSVQSNTVWPMPKFHFQVAWDDQTMPFQEVSGLDVDSQPIEYRSGDGPVFSTLKLPGMRDTGTVTLKQGIFTKDNTFWDWFNAIKMNTIARKTMTISLLDEKGQPTMVWTLINAYPTKISGTDLEAEGNEVAVERIEIAHEGLTIESR